VRILSILTFYHPHWTGLTAHARRLAEGLARRGHQVTVLTSRYSPELAPDEVCRGVRVLRLPVLARVSRGVIMPTLPVAARRLVEAHDVVQFHTPILEAWLITTLACRAGKRALMTHHGDLVMPGRPFPGRFQRVWYTMRMKRANLVLDERLLEEAVRVSGERTYSRAVERALEAFVRRARAGSILELAGSGAWVGDLSAMRGDQPERRRRARGSR